MFSQPSLVVLGDINFALIAVTPRFPEPGESVIGREFYTSPGGKGGNQAVAAARLGARTKMVGRVGGDSFGQEMLDSMKGYGVDISGIAVEPDVHSGIAHITIDSSGQNKIIMVPGANARCGEQEVARVRQGLEDAHILLLQMALPLEVSLKAAWEARRLRRQVILDPAPAGLLPADAYDLLDYLIPNETEASFLVGFPVTDPPSAMRAAQELLRRGMKAAIIKMGEQGACYASPQGEEFLPAFRVKAVDTVAAGDAFNAAFAVALAEGKELRDAVTWGMAAGAVAVTKPGAQDAMATREEVEAMLRGRPER